MPRFPVAGPLLVVALLGCGDDARTADGAGGAGGSGATTNASSATATSSSTGGSVITSSASTGDGGAGGDGDGGSGGVPAATPRQVEIAIAGILNGDPATAVVLVHADDGTLKHELHGADLPQVLDLVDGDLVSLVESTMVSDRIAPGVDRVEVGSSLSHPCLAQSMTILVDVPEVTGAARYEVIAPFSIGGQATAPGVVSAAVRGCDGETVDVLVAAFDVSGAVLAHEPLLALPFVGGSTVDASVALDQAARTPATVAVSSIAGADRLFAHGSWEVPGSPLFEPGHTLELQPPVVDSLVFAPELLDPGFGAHVLRVMVQSVVPGGCSSASIFRLGPVGADLSFDAKALRRPIEHEDGTWGWAGEGDLGDTVVRSFRDGGRHWILREHPEHPTWPWPVLAMPDGSSLDVQPEGVRHVDTDERDGYADTVGRQVFDGTSTTRVVTTEACDR